MRYGITKLRKLFLVKMFPLIHNPAPLLAEKRKSISLPSAKSTSKAGKSSGCSAPDSNRDGQHIRTEFSQLSSESKIGV